MRREVADVWPAFLMADPRASGIEGMLGGLLGESGIDNLLSGGLSELIKRFRQNGYAETADSWVGQGSNRDVGPEAWSKFWITIR